MRTSEQFVTREPRNPLLSMCLHGDNMTLYRESAQNALGVKGGKENPGRRRKHNRCDAVSRSSVLCKNLDPCPHHCLLSTSSSSPHLGLRVSSEECAEIKRNAIYHMLRESPGTEYCLRQLGRGSYLSSQVMVPPCRPNAKSCDQSNVKEKKENRKSKTSSAAEMPVC